MPRDSKSGLEPAPGDLRIVQAFVNTWCRGTETLTRPRVLSDHLARWGLLGREVDLTEKDLDRAIAVRDGLRTLVAANSGRPLDAAAAERLNRAVADVPARFRCEPDDGLVHFEVASGELDGALARLLKIVAEAQLQRTWPRLKTCSDSACRLVFYDRSRGVSARWCMRRCANRLSGQRHRQRRGIKARPDLKRPSKASPSKR